jgi:hypothetical protein
VTHADGFAFVYNEGMAKQKTSRKRKSVRKTALHFIDLDQAERKAGTVMLAEREDMLVLYHALKAYKPSEDEEVLHMMLLETYEEILVVDYGEKPPWKI